VADKDIRSSGVTEMERYEHRRKNVGAKAVVLHGYDATTDSYYPITAIDNGDGTYSASGVAKPTERYSIANIEDAGTYKYYGFEDRNGSWYIMRKTVSTGAYDYTAGTSNYTSGWSGRVGASYQSYSATF
jgi:hypothetical protein